MTRQPMTREQAELALTQLDPLDVEAAQSEIERELHVRERCYDRWVAEGKISRIDAKDRMTRQNKAYDILGILLDWLPRPV